VYEFPGACEWNSGLVFKDIIESTPFELELLKPMKTRASDVAQEASASYNVKFQGI
jgi:hypothetical protein